MTKIKVAMVGGGIGGFIGEIHRMAMRLDDRYELVAGALSSDATRAMESAKELGRETRLVFPPEPIRLPLVRS